MAELTEELSNFIERIPAWWFAVLHPIDTCNNLLSIKNEMERCHKVVDMWLTAFFISLIIDLPLYHLHGIEFESFGFHLFIFLSLTFIMLASVFAFKIGLTLFSISSRFSDILAIYVACVLLYEPLFVIFQCFSEFRYLAVIDTIKRQHLHLRQAMNFFSVYAQSSARDVDFINVGSTLCSWLGLGLICVLSTLMAIVIAERYSASRIKSFSAVILTTTIFVVPLVALEIFLTTYATYVFMK